MTAFCAVLIESWRRCWMSFSASGLQTSIVCQSVSCLSCTSLWCVQHKANYQQEPTLGNQTRLHHSKLLQHPLDQRPRLHCLVAQLGFWIRVSYGQQMSIPILFSVLARSTYWHMCSSIGTLYVLRKMANVIEGELRYPSVEDTSDWASILRRWQWEMKRKRTNLRVLLQATDNEQSDFLKGAWIPQHAGDRWLIAQSIGVSGETRQLEFTVQPPATDAGEQTAACFLPLSRIGGLS